MVARDTISNFLGASMVILEGMSELAIVEAIACREGIDLSSDLWLQKFRISSDNVNVVRSIHEDSMGHMSTLSEK